MKPIILKPTIGLYSDQGAVKSSVVQLKKMLAADYTIVLLKAVDLVQQNWPASMRALVMPGGADIPYCQKLRGRGCENIRAFVTAGGVYIGVCAGSYFAGTALHFTCADGTIISGLRELEFFKGRVVGPLFGPYLEGTHASAKLVPIILAGQTDSVYLNGGGIFEGAHANEVLGRYQANQQAMAVRCKVGLGWALLYAVHPEYDQRFLATQVAAKVAGYASLEPMLQAGCGEVVRREFLAQLRHSLQNN